MLVPVILEYLPVLFLCPVFTLSLAINIIIIKQDWQLVLGILYLFFFLTCSCISLFLYLNGCMEDFQWTQIISTIQE